MSNERRIVARVQDADVVAGLKAGAAAYRARFIQLTGVSSLKQDDAELFVLEATSDIGATLAELDAAKAAFPGVRLIVVARGDTRPEDVRRLFRAGATDVLSPPISQDQLLAAMSEALGAAANGGERGAVIAVVKAAGGVGATSIAANLGAYFASPVGKRGEQNPPRRTALLDFDIQFGDAALALDLRPRGTITDILKNPKRLDTHFLEGLLEKHKTGLKLLPAPPAVIPLDALDSAVALSIIETAAQTHELVFLDMPYAFTDWTSTVLRRADHLLLVAGPTVRGAAGARRVLDAAASLDVDAARWSLVFNRAQGMLDTRDMIDHARSALKAQVLATISEDPAAREANDRGRTIWESANGSRFAKDLRGLAAAIERLSERTQPETIRRPR